MAHFPPTSCRYWPSCCNTPIKFCASSSKSCMSRMILCWAFSSSSSDAAQWERQTLTVFICVIHGLIVSLSCAFEVVNDVRHVLIMLSSPSAVAASRVDCTFGIRFLAFTSFMIWLRKMSTRSVPKACGNLVIDSVTSLDIDFNLTSRCSSDSVTCLHLGSRLLNSSTRCITRTIWFLISIISCLRILCVCKYEFFFVSLAISSSSVWYWNDWSSHPNPPASCAPGISTHVRYWGSWWCKGACDLSSSERRSFFDFSVSEFVSILWINSSRSLIFSTNSGALEFISSMSISIKPFFIWTICSISFCRRLSSSASCFIDCNCWFTVINWCSWRFTCCKRGCNVWSFVWGLFLSASGVCGSSSIFCVVSSTDLQPTSSCSDPAPWLCLQSWWTAVDVGPIKQSRDAWKLFWRDWKISCGSFVTFVWTQLLRRGSAPRSSFWKQRTTWYMLYYTCIHIRLNFRCH